MINIKNKDAQIFFVGLLGMILVLTLFALAGVIL